jgi:quinol monooxygenase YgiN
MVRGNKRDKPMTTGGKYMRSNLFLLAFAMMAVAPAVQAQEAPFYTATYVDLVPTAKDQGATILRSLLNASRKDESSAKLTVVQNLFRPSHFVILGEWKDQKAFEAAAPSSKQLQEKLEPLFASPNDERQHNALTVAAAKPASSAAVYVVTHVDVPPPRKDDVIPMLQALATAARGEANNLRFDVWQQSSRPNHFTVVEAWSNREAYDNHVMAAHTKQFRAKLVPMTGALYDERLHHSLD